MIVSYNHLPALRQEAGETPVFLKAGCFDVFHDGHLDILDFLRSLGGVSVVGVNPDSRVRQRKGPSRPIRGESQRIQDVEESGLVDYVFPIPEGVLGVPRSIYRLRPTAFVEHQTDSIIVKAIPMRTLLKLAGIGYIVCDRPRICSTTEIIEGKIGLGIESQIFSDRGNVALEDTARIYQA